LALYNLKFFCCACKEFHDLSESISLAVAFQVRTISDVYGDGEVPCEITRLIEPVHCPNAGTWVAPSNYDHVLLVSAEWLSRRTRIRGQLNLDKRCNSKLGA
jgi:hypothetical protein